jgi:TatD DNase family protein
MMNEVEGFMGLVDSHAHLDMEDFSRDLPSVLMRALEAGVETIISVGIDVESSKRAADIAKENKGVFSTVGMHPHNAAVCRDEDLQELAALASSGSKVVAWGEIGLDYNRNYAPHERQVEVFERQLELSLDLSLPVIIHDREAHQTVLEILKRFGKARGVIHCFSGDLDLALAFIAMGFHISIPGTVTYKKAYTVREVAMKTPLDRLLVETDAPFLAPVPLRGRRNEPAFVRYTAEEIARIRGLDLERLSETLSANAKNLFGIE